MPYSFQGSIEVVLKSLEPCTWSLIYLHHLGLLPFLFENKVHTLKKKKLGFTFTSYVALNQLLHLFIQKSPNEIRTMALSITVLGMIKWNCVCKNLAQDRYSIDVTSH